MGWGMINLSELLKTIISGYVIVFILYYFLSKDIDNSDLVSFFLRLAPIFSLLAIPLYFLPAQRMIPIILCGFFNMLTFPLLNYLTKRKENITFNFPYDFAFGLYIMVFLASLQLVGQSFLPKIFLVIVLSLLEILLLMIPVAEVIYYGYYGENISLYATLAILGTENHEVKEYLKNMPVINLISNLLMLLVVFILVAYANVSFVYISPISSEIVGILLVILFFRVIFMVQK